MAYFFPHTGHISRFATLGLIVALLTSVPAVLPYAAPVPPTHPAQAPSDVRIAAVVNGDVITNVDVEDRAKLFALSTGQPISPDVLARLRPQILRQLVDERLRIQEAQRRKVVIQDKQIAEAIHSIEERNNLPPGTLRQKLAADGISLRTLVDQIRTQLAWIQVIREQLGPQSVVTQAQVAERQHVLEQETGKPEYHVAEIIIPIEDPANAADAQRFAETVITQLRAGAPFSVVAAQFSQSQNALEGGDLGWIEPSRLDPAVARVVDEMPPGAVSNPIRIPGGIAIVTLMAKRDVGREMGTMLSIRQVFLPFTAPLNPQTPTEQQRQMLQKARSISTSVHSCDQMEEVAKANPSPHPVNPGDVRLETVSPPAFKQLLSTIPVGQVTQPLVSNDGITLMVVCSREEKNLATGDPQALRAQIVEERAELAARQLEQSLRRQATIDIRPTA